MPLARRPAIGPPVIRRATPFGIAARPRQRRLARRPTATGSAAPNFPLRQGGSASQGEPAHTRAARNRQHEARRRRQRTPPAPTHCARQRRRASGPPSRRPAIGPLVIRQATPSGIAARPRQCRRARRSTATGSAAPNFPLRQGGSASCGEPAFTRGARNRSREARRRRRRTPPAPAHCARRRRRASVPPARRLAIGPSVILGATPCGIAARPHQRRPARRPTATCSAAPNVRSQQGGSAFRVRPAHTREARSRTREARGRGQRTPPAPGHRGRRRRHASVPPSRRPEVGGLKMAFAVGARRFSEPVARPAAYRVLPHRRRFPAHTLPATRAPPHG